MTDELWDNVVSVNLSGTFYLCREFLVRLADEQAGSIVNISSIAGVYGNGGAAYSASKYGVIGLTKNIALQYAGTGVRCNAVCPGPTPTELNLTAGEAGAVRPGVHDDLRAAHRHDGRRVGRRRPSGGDPVPRQ